MPKRKTYLKNRSYKKRSYKKRSYKKKSYKKRSYKKKSYLRGGADEHLPMEMDEKQLSDALDTLEDFPAAAMDSPLSDGDGDGGDSGASPSDAGEEVEGTTFIRYHNAEGVPYYYDSETGETQWDVPQITPPTAHHEMDFGEDEFDFSGSDDLGMLPSLDEPGIGPLGAVANFGQLGSQAMVGPMVVPMAGDDEPVCMFVGIGESQKAHNGTVQREPFSRVDWVYMKKPQKPMCKGCTSTLRKHYNGKTNSPELAAAFVKEVQRYKCPRCNVWNDGAIAAAAVPPNLVCRECKWTAGSGDPNKPRKAPGARRPRRDVPENVPAGALDSEESRDVLGAIEEFDSAGGAFDQHGVTAFMGNPMGVSLGDQTLQPWPAQAMETFAGAAQPPSPVSAKARSRSPKRSKEQEEGLPTRWRCRTDPGWKRTDRGGVDCYTLQDELSPKFNEYNVRWSTLISIFTLLKKEPGCTDVETLSRGVSFASNMQCRARVAKLNSIFETMTGEKQIQMDKFNKILMVNAYIGDGFVCQGRKRVDPSEIVCEHGTAGCHGSRETTRNAPRRQGKKQGGDLTRVGVHNKECKGHVHVPPENKCSNYKTKDCQYNPRNGRARHTVTTCPGYKQRDRTNQKRKKRTAAQAVMGQPVAPAPPPPPAYQMQQPPAAQAVAAFAVPQPPAPGL